jgi:glycosyltransferase involved in cell wall biosynthesis
MRVVMLTSSYPKWPGETTAPFIEEIAQGVAARGHEVDVLLPHHPQWRRPAVEGRVRFWPYRYAPDAWSLWGYAQSLEADVRVKGGVYLLAPLVALALRHALSARLTSSRCDVVHAHWVVPNAALVTDVVRAHGLPFVISLHGSDVFMAERLAPARGLARAAFEAAGAVTACSGDLRARALRLGAREADTRTVPYGVDVETFSPRIDGTRWRARLGLAPGELLVLALGRLVEKKGFRHLIDAAAGCDGLRVVLAGDGDLRAQLEQQARTAGAPVTFVGNLERGVLAEALAAADVVAVPSVVDRAGNVDGLPNTLLEALAAGRALVASRVAGIPDVVRDGDNGLLVPPGDAPSLRAALRRLRDDAQLRAGLGRCARRTALERLTWPVAARAFEECYLRAGARG